MPSKPRQVEHNPKTARVPSPANLVSSYLILGGLGNDLLLNVSDLTELEAKFLLCGMLDGLKNVRYALDKGNLSGLIEALKGLDRFQTKDL